MLCKLCGSFSRERFSRETAAKVRMKWEFPNESGMSFVRNRKKLLPHLSVR